MSIEKVNEGVGFTTDSLAINHNSGSFESLNDAQKTYLDFCIDLFCGSRASEFIERKATIEFIEDAKGIHLIIAVLPHGDIQLMDLDYDHIIKAVPLVYYPSVLWPYIYRCTTEVEQAFAVHQINLIRTRGQNGTRFNVLDFEIPAELRKDLEEQGYGSSPEAEAE